MRVKVDNDGAPPSYAELVGIIAHTETTDESVVVRLDHYGLYLTIMHPSRITPLPHVVDYARQ